jgi:hypothetical protein
MVSAVGVTRRLRALYWMGHRSRELAHFTGLHEDTVLGLARGRWERTTVARRDAVCAAYDRLAMSYGSSERARRFAADNGWHGPLAWDDDTIDDPRAVPQTDAVEPVATEGENVVARWLMGESVVLGAEHRDEAVAHLFEWTSLTAEEIAERVGMSKAAAEQVWYRLKRKARKEGRPEPRRRLYALRDRELTNNELGEAA